MASTEPESSASFPNITLNTNVACSDERYRDIDFHKTSWTVSQRTPARRFADRQPPMAMKSGSSRIDPGRLMDYSLTATFRPYRACSQFKVDETAEIRVEPRAGIPTEDHDRRPRISSRRGRATSPS
jgi:hypothetical protein